MAAWYSCVTAYKNLDKTDFKKIYVIVPQLFSAPNKSSSDSIFSPSQVILSKSILNWFFFTNDYI